MDFGVFRQRVEAELRALEFPAEPAELYEPVRYILGLGGKRLRPVLVLAGCSLVGGKVEQAMGPALGMEVFHNFTLLHDDIMDSAPLRRNQPTVHTRWNTNIAILSGDVMYTLACRLMNQVPDHTLRMVNEVFHRNAAAVCEGQQMDMNFETMEQVGMEQYLKMIRLKTAVLLGASLQIGALCGGTGTELASGLFEAGCLAGVAFQLQDDMLDVFGQTSQVGKRAGGDIAANKQTYLKIRAWELANETQKAELDYWYKINSGNTEEKVSRVTTLFRELGLEEDTRALARSYFESAKRIIGELDLDQQGRLALLAYFNQLHERTH